MSGKYNKFTVKDLADYCNKLCEEGHGSAKVYIKTEAERLEAEDFEVEQAVYDNDTLCIAPDTPIVPVSQASSEDLLQELRYREDWYAMTDDILKEIIPDMEDDEKLKLVKKLLNEAVE